MDGCSVPERVEGTVRKPGTLWQVDEIIEREKDADMTGVVLMGERDVKVPQGAIYAVKPTSSWLR